MSALRKINNYLSERLCTKLRERFSQFSQISVDAAFIKLDMKVVSSVLEEIISEIPELVVPERKGIVDYINIEPLIMKFGKGFFCLISSIIYQKK